MAIRRRRPPKGLIHHSDRGVQYASNAFQDLLDEHGLRCSMSRKGDCYDNAFAESFFHTLKVELTHHRIYTTASAARHDIARYINGFYNPIRKHSSIGYKSPLAFERAQKPTWSARCQVPVNPIWHKMRGRPHEA